MPYLVPLTAACAVIGHCWTLFAQFRGGMGLATFGGALLAVNWFAFVIGLGVLLLLTLTIRQAGFGWGALVLLLDIAKGFLPTYLALQVAHDGSMPYLVPLTAACAVIGHCWTLFAQFRGGMGLATFGGALLAINWFAFIIGLGLLLLLTITIHHSARASVAAGILMAPVFWLLGLRGIEFWTALAGGLVIAYRFLMDWNRKYRELWLDREKKP